MCLSRGGGGGGRVGGEGGKVAGGQGAGGEEGTRGRGGAEGGEREVLIDACVCVRVRRRGGWEMRADRIFLLQTPAAW